MSKKWKYVAAGALAGAANGLFGSGGGLFLVPMLAGWVKMKEKKAFASSVAVILPLSVLSAAVYWLKGAMDFTLAWPYLLGGFLGGAVSGKIFKKVPVLWLRRGFGLLIIYGGIRGVMGL